MSVATAISTLIRSCCELPVLQLEGGHGGHMLLYQLKSVYLNQRSSNGVMCFWNELECQQERWRVPLPFRCGATALGVKAEL